MITKSEVARAYFSFFLAFVLDCFQQQRKPQSLPLVSVTGKLFELCNSHHCFSLHFQTTFEKNEKTFFEREAQKHVFSTSVLRIIIKKKAAWRKFRHKRAEVSKQRVWVCLCVCVCVCVCVCQNDNLHRVNTPALDSCFGLIGHHQQGAECDPVQSQPLNIRAYAQPLSCGCKLSKITPLACAVTMTTSHHKTREKLLPSARDSESRTVDLAARTRCAKRTASIRSTLLPWTAEWALLAIISR